MKNVSTRSKLIQPIISTEAISQQAYVVPGSDPDSSDPEISMLPSRSVAVSRVRQASMTSLPLLSADILLLTTCYCVASYVTYLLIGSSYYAGLWKNFLALCTGFVILGSPKRLFSASGINPVCELRNLIHAITGSFVIVVVLNGLLGEVTRNEIITIALAYPAAVLFAPVVRYLVRRICSGQEWWGEKAIIVGSGPQAAAVYRYLKQFPQRGLKPIGVVDCSPSDYWKSSGKSTMDFLGTTSELLSICRREKCHWVFAVLAGKSEKESQRILNYGGLIPNLIVLPTNLSLPTLWTDSFDAAGIPGVHIRDRLLFPFQRFSKRIFDIVFGTCVLILSCPLLLFIAVWIKLTSPGPVFYRHHGRIGRGGRVFGAMKIRTMVKNADQILKQYLKENPEARAEWQRDLKLKNDPRVIPGIGRFLRRTSLDELPQLWNVIRGDMSLVGPRPIVADEIEKYREMYHLYHRVRPGMTGLWQVSGRNNTSYQDRVHLDTYYVLNWSMWLDYFILLRTLKTVLMREGSY
jgi:Undecaprenyl-phosphate galactose phosphotransferase WbaP